MENSNFTVESRYKLYESVYTIGCDEPKLREVEISYFQEDFEYPFKSIEKAKEWLTKKDNYPFDRNEVVILHTLVKRPCSFGEKQDTADYSKEAVDSRIARYEKNRKQTEKATGAFDSFCTHNWLVNTTNTDEVQLARESWNAALNAVEKALKMETSNSTEEIIDMVRSEN